MPKGGSTQVRHRLAFGIGAHVKRGTLELKWHIKYSEIPLGRIGDWVSSDDTATQIRNNMGDKDDRWWLPGPPPSRRLMQLSEVEESYLRDGIPPLAIPVREVHLNSFSCGDDLCPRYPEPKSDPRECSGPLLLYHGCAHITSQDIFTSFASWGPSIRFSRSRGYFSASPAVYWTNSITFAISWCIFTETGSWKLADSDARTKPFNCLIYVTKVDMVAAALVDELYIIPPPMTCHEELELTGQ